MVCWLTLPVAISCLGTEGFTAWSSMREPTQVLLLLETIYRAFDEIAKRRKVFKVETIGDCYGKRNEACLFALEALFDVLCLHVLFLS